MRKTAFVLFLILILAGCQAIKPGGVETSKLKVAATFFPHYDILRNVAGDKLKYWIFCRLTLILMFLN